MVALLVLVIVVLLGFNANTALMSDARLVVAIFRLASLWRSESALSRIQKIAVVFVLGPLFTKASPAPVTDAQPCGSSHPTRRGEVWTAPQWLAACAKPILPTGLRFQPRQ